METKPITMWDHLANITDNKGDYLGDENWNIFMINRFLSMDKDYCEVVDALQKNLRYGSYIPPETMYKVLRDIIPKQKKYLKYTKAENPKKYEADELAIVAEYYEISQKQAKAYVDLLDKKQIKELIKQYNGK
jgi:hypothetical protein